MSIFHREKDKPEEPALPVDDAAEKFTDISDAASSPAEAEDGEMEEIYSTRSKLIKYKRLTPIEAEAAAKRQKATKEDLILGKLEFSSSAPAPMPEVELKAELDPEAVVAEEIIEDVRDVRNLRGIYVQDIDDIDISLDPMESLREYEKQANDKERYEARRAEKVENPYVSAPDKIITRVPVYQHESRVEKIFLKAGRFTDVVENEYDEYLRSTDPTISKDYHALQKAIKPRQSLLITLSQMAQKHKEETEQKKELKKPRENFDEVVEPSVKKKESGVAKFFRILGALIADTFASKAAEKEEESPDYNSREDEKYVQDQIKTSIKRLSIHTAVFGLITVTMLVLAFMKGADTPLTSIPLLYCGIHLVLMLFLGGIGYRYIIDGIRPLPRFRGNCDTAAALAYSGCLLQSIVAMFTASSFVTEECHFYGFIAGIALMLNSIGRLLMAVRVKNNFSFITSHSPAYAAKIYNDEETARRMISGTTASKGVIAYHHITRFLSDFLKISYAPDPSEETSGKLAPITAIISVFVTIIYAIIFKSVAGTISALAVMLCISVPFTALLAGNIPMLIFSKKMLHEGAMVAGYPSVRQFCDTSAVMASAHELFPKGCVKLHELVPFLLLRMEENLLMAAAVLREAASPIAPVFDELVVENDNTLPSVESVMYEDKSGLVGWINGERVLIGNRALMHRYHITVPEKPIEKKERSKGREITYIAIAGQAVAMLSLSYLPSPIAKKQLQKGESNGLAFIVSTPDPNITAELIAEKYEIFYRSVKVVSPGYANVIEEVTTKKEETSRAYLATRGRLTSLARAVGGCIGIKANITLGIIVEIFGMLLGVLLCATLALNASVARLTVLEMLIYIFFWTAATILVGVVRRT